MALIKITLRIPPEETYRIWQNFRGLHDFTFNREYYICKYIRRFHTRCDMSSSATAKFSCEWSFAYQLRKFSNSKVLLYTVQK